MGMMLQAYWGVLLLVGRLQGSLYLNQVLAVGVEIPAILMMLLLLDRIGRNPIFCFALLQGDVRLNHAPFAEAA